MKELRVLTIYVNNNLLIYHLISQKGHSELFTDDNTYSMVEPSCSTSDLLGFVLFATHAATLLCINKALNSPGMSVPQFS